VDQWMHARDPVCWELSPEFDLNILPPEASPKPKGVRMISEQLRLSGEAGVAKLPPVHHLPPNSKRFS